MNKDELELILQILEAATTANDGLAVHPLGVRSNKAEVCVGRDNLGRRHFLVPAGAESKVRSFRSAGLSGKARRLVRDGRETNFFDLVCLVPSLNDAFNHLLLDVLQSMRPDESDAVAICNAVLERWQELFGGGASTGAERAKGLIGELLILEKLSSLDPTTLDNWTGGAGGIHDFRKGTRALEVKTTQRRYGRYISIASHLQLVPPEDGELHLVLVRLERVPDGKYSVNELERRIVANGVDPFTLKRLIRERCDSESDMDDYRFELMELLVFKVDDRFPKIVEQSFVGGHLPPAVIGLSYELDLSSGPDAVATDAVNDVFRQLVAGA